MKSGMVYACEDKSRDIFSPFLKIKVSTHKLCVCVRMNLHACDYCGEEERQRERDSFLFSPSCSILLYFRISSSVRSLAMLGGMNV